MPGPSIPGQIDPYFGARTGIPGSSIDGIIESVDTRNGVVNIRLGHSAIGTRNGVKIPFFQVSVLRSNSSWLRFMPQVGDRVNLVQGMDGRIHIMNYEVLNYKQLADADEEEEFLFRELKEGEYELRSAGAAEIFGSRSGILRMAGGASTLTLNRDDMIATLDAPLITANATSCQIRFGEVRRKVLPTDFGETALALGSQREFRLTVAKDILLASVPMVDIKLGDVVTDTTPFPVKPGGLGAPLRGEFRVFDPTGLIPMFSFRVDSGGSLEILQTVGTITLQPGTILRLGGPASTEPVVLGLLLNTFLTNFINVLTAAVVQTAVGPGTFNPATIAALNALIPQLVTHLSTVAFSQKTATPGVP